MLKFYSMEENKIKTIEHAINLLNRANHEGMSNYRIAQMTGISQKSIGNYVNGKTKPTYPNSVQIIDCFEKNNKTEENLPANVSNNINFENYSGVPYYEDIESTGNIKNMFSDIQETAAFYINYEHFNDCTAYLTHVGDSMYPKYCSGEIIALKRIFNFDIVLWGEAYLIVTNENANNLRTVKLVFQHEDEDKIILRASNPNFKGDTVIYKSDIVSMFMVKGKITRNQL